MEPSDAEGDLPEDSEQVYPSWLYFGLEYEGKLVNYFGHDDL